MFRQKFSIYFSLFLLPEQKNISVYFEYCQDVPLPLPARHKYTIRNFYVPTTF